MSDEVVHLAIDRGVATITLDAPSNRNALSRRLLADLERHLDTALGADDARVLVLTATGTVFCSGADLKEQREANVAGASGPGQIGPGGLVRVVTRLWESPKPVVARVNGAARAGGIGLMSACDIVVAAETATFAFSEVRIGVVPAIIAVVTLPRLGPVRGMELMLTGEAFDARAAADWGFITRAVPAAELDAAVARYVDALRRGGPGALAETKRMVRRVPGLPTSEAFAEMTALSARMFASPEAREGMTAFAEKRPPRWTEGA